MEYETFQKLNEFVQTGHLVYVDRRQKLDRIFGKTVAGLEIETVQYHMVPGGEPNSSIPDDQISRTTRRFMVDRIDVIERSQSQVVYRLMLVDWNILNLTRNISISGYGSDSEVGKNVGDIIMAIFQQAEIPFYGPSLANVRTNLDYISKENDNTMTAFRFLMRRDFFFGNGNASDSLNVLLQNTNAGNYGIYNLKNPDVDWIYSGEKPGEKLSVPNIAYLSMFDTDQLEEMVHKRQLQIQSLSLKGRMDVLDTFQTTRIQTFDIKSGWGEPEVFSSAAIHGLFSGSEDSPEEFKYASASKVMEGHIRYGATWDMPFDMYEEQVDNVLNYDSFVIKQEGHLNRIPGMTFVVGTNNPEPYIDEMSGPEGSDMMDQDASKYSEFVGVWTISSVRHTFDVAGGKFEDTICLFRNINASPEEGSGNGAVAT